MNKARVFYKNIGGSEKINNEVPKGEPEDNQFDTEELFWFAEAYADQELEEANNLLEKFTVGFKWDIENKHPKPEPDRADYEFYDEVKAYLNKLKQ